MEGEKVVKNTLGDLNNHLYAQLERLSDEDIKGEKLQEEMQRARAITSVAHQIVANGSLVLQAQRFHTEYQSEDLNKPKMLEG